MGSTNTAIKVTKKQRKSAGSKKGRQHVHNEGKYRQQVYRTAANKEKHRKNNG